MLDITVGVRPVKNTLTWPKDCPCCLDAADTSTSLVIKWDAGGKRITERWSVPICGACLLHKDRAEKINWVFGLMFAASLISFLFGYAKSEPIAYIASAVLFVASITGLALFGKRYKNEAKKMLKPNCTGLTCISFTRIISGETKGELLFSFSNKEYANKFSAINNGRFLSSSEIKKLHGPHWKPEP